MWILQTGHDCHLLVPLSWVRMWCPQADCRIGPFLPWYTKCFVYIKFSVCIKKLWATTGSPSLNMFIGTYAYANSEWNRMPTEVWQSSKQINMCYNLSQASALYTLFINAGWGVMNYEMGLQIFRTVPDTGDFRSLERLLLVKRLS